MFSKGHRCVHVGREARTYGLGLDLAKVELDAYSGKIIVDSSDTTTARNIFAIGDAINVSRSHILHISLAHETTCMYMHAYTCSTCMYTCILLLYFFLNVLLYLRIFLPLIEMSYTH